MLAGLTIGLAALAILAMWFLHQEKFGALPEGERLARILRSPHQKDGVFQNREETPVMTDERGQVAGLLDFFFGKHPRKRPDAPLPSVKRDLLNLDPSQDLVVWFGHSSYLLQLGGVRFLVDPIFSGRASPLPVGLSAFPGSDRYTVDDLPPIDVLLITHDHWDHLDHKTVTALRPKVGRVICGLGVGAHLERWGYDPSQLTELDWGEGVTIPHDLRLTAVPARHFSGRGLKSGRSLWCAYALKSPRRAVFLGGDGGYGRHFKDIGAQHGPFDLAVLEQGQYDEGWRHIHLLPRELPQAMRDLQAARLLPVHNAKFSLANHPWDEPLESLADAAKAGGFTALTPPIGELTPLDGPPPTAAWWRTPGGA